MGPQVYPEPFPVGRFRPMKTAIPLLFAALLSLQVSAAPSHDLPSCDLNAEHALRAPVGGEMKDERQAHILMRSDVLRADIAGALKSMDLSQSEVEALSDRLGRIQDEVAAFVREQGFLSAGERASYDRELDEIAGRICP